MSTHWRSRRLPAALRSEDSQTVRSSQHISSAVYVSVRPPAPALQPSSPPALQPSSVSAPSSLRLPFERVVWPSRSLVASREGTLVQKPRGGRCAGAVRAPGPGGAPTRQIFAVWSCPSRPKTSMWPLERRLAVNNEVKGFDLQLCIFSLTEQSVCLCRSIGPAGVACTAAARCGWAATTVERENKVIDGKALVNVQHAGYSWRYRALSEVSIRKAMRHLAIY